MATEPAEGMWKCRVIDGEAKADDRDIMHVRINVEVLNGPDRGRFVMYDEAVNNKQAPYIAKTAKAVGWRGRGLLEDTLAADIAAWVASTGGESTVEIRHIQIKNGKRAGQVWGKVNSIGRGPRPLKAPSREASNDANAAMMAALAEDGGYDSNGAPPPDDIPPAGDDDIPFASASMAHDRVTAQIAKVLR